MKLHAPISLDPRPRCRSGPSTSARAFRPHAPSASRCSCSRWTKSTASCFFPTRPTSSGETPLTRSSEAGKESYAVACAHVGGEGPDGRGGAPPDALTDRARDHRGEPGPDRVALVGIQTRGVPLAQRLRSARSTSPSTATTSRFAVAERPSSTAGRPLDGARFLLEGKTVALVDDVLYTGGRSGPRPRRSSTTAGQSVSSSQCSSTVATGSSRSGPITSARTFRPHATSASRCSSLRLTRSITKVADGGGFGGHPPAQKPQPTRRCHT
jgi:hypothetical protein